jgi:CheY-like chemotaxis protein/HPt (histidine-containing phosphotransfer) domain-containing protein
MQLISFILKKAGAAVEVAENGKIAVDKALLSQQNGNPFDLILMDMQMPVLDGYSATRMLRKQGYDRPIIALTAHAMAEDRSKCIHAGCNDFACKPIDKAQLMSTLQKYLGKEGPAVPQPESPQTLVSELAGDPDLAELLDHFTAELPKRVSAIENSLMNNDWETLSKLAHQLAGAGGSYGFPLVSTAARTVELLTKNNPDIEDLKEKVQALTLLCRQIRPSRTTESQVH